VGDRGGGKEGGRWGGRSGKEGDRNKWEEGELERGGRVGRRSDIEDSGGVGDGEGEGRGRGEWE